MSDHIDTIPLMKWQAEQKGYTCNDCYLSMQNCRDKSICCEDETGLCDYFEEMPRRTTMSDLIRINLNEPIKVKLTDWGKDIYYHQYDRTNRIAGREICKPKFPKEDENGYTEFQLWHFMELYGEYIGMTLPNVIEPLEIVYER